MCGVARAAYISFQKRDIPRSKRGIIGTINFEFGKKIQGAQIRIANKPYICTAEMKKSCGILLPEGAKGNDSESAKQTRRKRSRSLIG